MRAIAVIPARYGSTRFPGKPLALIQGRPVIQHVYENAAKAQEISRVIVATDHSDIFSAVKSFSGEARMTSADCPSGSDRVAEVARNLDCDIIVNIQGDEPLLTSAMIDATVTILKNCGGSIGTLAKKIEKKVEIRNPNTVKVVFDRYGKALYFSRSPIPFYRDVFLPDGTFPDAALSSVVLYKHIGIYSYWKETLLQLTKLPPSNLENIEKLEQLRALENGFAIYVALTESDTIGIDTPEDLERVKQWLSSSS
ncbi:MAG: 3-deoxy-manno-octulosonate cytidylyltransferase [bacterium]